MFCGLVGKMGMNNFEVLERVYEGGGLEVERDGGWGEQGLEREAGTEGIEGWGLRFRG